MIPVSEAYDAAWIVRVMPDSEQTKAQLLESLHGGVAEFTLDPAAPAELRKTPTHDKPTPDETAELEHLYRTAPVGLCLLDKDLRYLRINERLAAINGRPISEHLGRTLREVIPDIAANLVNDAIIGVEIFRRMRCPCIGLRKRSDAVQWTTPDPCGGE